ncbi:hypothetical protein ANN_02449 [Periplaneta americana]|uniref:Uncharacterized protein n=1 Tax=Periplaneta americana TaxID=6978 RepID=A0ABQ8TXE9_PERAM|nr:hypothetical protein ANN_02449 [Periplaneta americana]
MAGLCEGGNESPASLKAVTADSVYRPPWNVVKRRWMASTMAPEADLFGEGVSPRTDGGPWGEFAEAGMEALTEANRGKESVPNLPAVILTGFCARMMIILVHCLNRSDLVYCATCNSDTHYTGQARCPKYPRTNLITSTDPTHVPIDTNKPIPPPIRKPSQSVFKPTLPKPELSYADAAKTMTTKTTTTADPQTDKTTTVQLVEGVLRSAMQKIESYIDRQLNRLQDEIVTFTISLLTTATNPTKRHTTLATANQAARRLLRKRVAFHFVGNRLRVSLAPLQKRD